jgi:cytochrome c5
MSKRILLLLTILGTLPFLMAHGGGCSGDETEVFGPPTQATCVSGSTLTYANFGQPFMTSYCTRCHSSALTGAARNGATRFHDYDVLSGIKSVSDHIDQTAASGPGATNTSMPPSGPFPTEEERKKLGEWIACGAP